MNCVPVFHSVCLLSISTDNHEKKNKNKNKNKIIISEDKLKNIYIYSFIHFARFLSTRQHHTEMQKQSE